MLQNSDNEEIYKLAYEIIEQYFSDDVSWHLGIKWYVMWPSKMSWNLQILILRYSLEKWLHNLSNRSKQIL